MKRILIMGKNGFLGRNFLDYFSNRYFVDAPSRNELNAYDGEKVESFLKAGRYDVFINALNYNLKSDHNITEHGLVSSRLRMFFNFARMKDLYGKMVFFGSGAEYDRLLPVENISENDFDRRVPLDEYGFCLHTMTQYALQVDNIINLGLFVIFGPHEIWKTRFISNAICKALYGFPITIRQDRVLDYLYINHMGNYWG